jgi:hypothetical protein
MQTLVVVLSVVVGLVAVLLWGSADAIHRRVSLWRWRRACARRRLRCDVARLMRHRRAA